MNFTMLKKVHSLKFVGEDTGGPVYWCEHCGIIVETIDGEVGRATRKTSLFNDEYSGTGQRCSR